MSDSVTYPDAITSGAAVSPPPTWVATYRPAAPRNGLVGYATDTAVLELYGSSQWQTVITSLTLGSATLVMTALLDSPSYDDDAAAAAGGVVVGGIYRNGNFVMIRLT